MTQNARIAANWKYVEANLPALRRIPAERLRELRDQARPGESWHQVIERVNGKGGSAFKADLAPCRLCHSTQGYLTFACKQMGICDACNTALEAELADDAAAPVQVAQDLYMSHLVVDLGPGWIPCADALPWSDWCREFDYVVYSPDRDGDLVVCQFNLTGARWWSKGLDSGIGNVTHWRLALPEERDRVTVTAPLPGPTFIDETALARLRSWWSWFREHQGLDDD